MKVFVSFMAVLALASPAMARKKPKLPLVEAPVVEPVATPDSILHLDLSTGGAVVIAMRPDKAPNSVARIRMLTRAGFYDGLSFHRVIDGFMAQTGDPLGTGAGGSPLPDLKAEFNDLPHVRGAVSMARADSIDSANSQFFICFMPVLRLDNRYTVFGRVTSGMQYVDVIPRGEPGSGEVPIAERAKIVHAWIEADGPNAAKVPLVVPAAPAAPPPSAPPQIDAPPATPPSPPSN